jgi:transcriptional regulator with XRE-family HTH domain
MPARDRDTFGPRLRVERERRGISLKQIAESTKIKESLFVELERSDFSKWPQGIFRRAHLCAYVSAIGLPPEPVLAEHLRLFPEECPVDQPDHLVVKDTAPARHAEGPLEPGRFALPLMDRVWVVVFDVAAVCLMSSILAALTGMNLWPAIGFAGVAYSAIGSACFAQSIGTYVRQRMNRPAQKTTVREVQPREVQPKLQPTVSQRTRGGLSERDTNPEREVEIRRASA